MKNRSWTLTARVKANGKKTHGVVMAFGGVAAGMVLYVRDGVPIFDYLLLLLVDPACENDEQELPRLENEAHGQPEQ